MALRDAPLPSLLSRRTWLIGTGAFVSASFVRPAFAEELVVVVNQSNPETPSQSELAAIFTTRKQSWGGGKRVVPFNFPAKHELRVSFDESVLEMTPDEVARYWIDRRIRGGNPPPKQVSSSSMIVRLVEKLEGAVAYVPRSAVTANVRVVRGV